jgi:molybdopterin/thiamine biosynthesis adenylyltransferase
LARAGVGRLVLIDPDRFESSNLERMHGSESRHIRERPFKVGIVAELCRRINPNIEIVQIVGNALQPLATDWLVQSDLVLSCTDTNHSRVGLSELAYRYIVPVIDTGVLLDGSRGRVVGEVIQVTHYYPGGPCAYCRSLVDSWRLTVEMMPESERE